MNATVAAQLDKFAAADLRAARREGYMLIGQTKRGTLTLTHEAGVYTLSPPGQIPPKRPYSVRLSAAVGIPVRFPPGTGEHGRINPTKSESVHRARTHSRASCGPGRAHRAGGRTARLYA